MDYKTIDKKLTKNIWNLAYPSMISFLLETLYDLVDMIWIGKISKTALAGVTIFTTVFWLFTFFNELIGASSVSLISQYHGKKDYDRTRIVSEQTISFKMIMGVFSGLLLFIFLKPILGLYSKNPYTIKYAMDYGYLRIFFIPLMFASYSINTIFRCHGDSKTPMRIMTIATIFNIILDPILMFEKVPFIGIKGFNLGVFGAALATVLSTILTLIIGGYFLYSNKNNIKVSLKGLLKMNRDIDKKLLTIGFPSAVENFTRSLFLAVLMKFIAHYGDAEITVIGIISKLMMFAFMPLEGFMMGGSVVVGHLIGEKNIDYAKRAADISARLNAYIMSVFTFLFIIFSKQAFMLFSHDQNILNIGVSIAPYVSISLPLEAYSLGKSVAFMGSGYTKPLLIATLVPQWLIQLPFAAFVTYGLNLPFKFITFSYPLYDLTFLIIILYFYKKDTWKTNKVTY